MENRRRSPRIARQLSIESRFDSLETAAQAQTLDVSRHGLFIVMKHPKPVGTRLRCVVAIEEPAQEYVLDGLVVRVQHGDHPPFVAGMGIEILGTPEGWEAFCDELAEAQRDGN